MLTGAEIDRLSDAELADRADRLEVCCRVSPQHKLPHRRGLQARDHVVAMTGDGVNDAPALKRANIGVAMGVTGTDVAKQTADMVLTDDNFASIVSAIEQGRIIYSNIRKFVYFLLACNVGEILIVFGAMLVGLPMPLRPVQLLWLNLVSDGAPRWALGMEKGDKDTMRRPALGPRTGDQPRDGHRHRRGRGGRHAGHPGHLLAGHAALSAAPGRRADHGRSSPVHSELLRAFAARSETHSVFTIGLASNRWMLAAVGVSFALVLLAVVYRAVPGAVLRRRAAGRGRLAADAAVLLRLAGGDGAAQAGLPPPAARRPRPRRRPPPRPLTATERPS